ncbi:MAG: S-layer homology domain-containing protein [Fimbriimonadales bacterium]|nr:S-layer homology domain-containing protein [Fimbriimonadales bacterium]
MRTGIVLITAGLLTACAWTQMRDVPPGHWAYQAIRELVRLRVLEGFPDGEFKPNRQVSRAEFAQAVARAYRVVEERIREVETRLNRLAPSTPEAAQPSPQERQVQELQQAVRELQQLRSAIENLQRLAQEFETELSNLNVSVRDLRRDIASLEERIRREERRKQRLTGDMTLAVFGTHSYDKRSAYTLNGNAIHPSGIFAQSASIVHELGLHVDMPVNEQVDAKATFIVGNYLPYTREATRLADSLRLNKNAYSVGATDVAIWEAYITAPISLFGTRVQAQIGRIPLKLTPYTFQRIEPDYYLDFGRYRDRAHRADGALLSGVFGRLSAQAFFLSSYGIRSNTTRFLPIYFANHNASVSAAADQLAGLRLDYPFSIAGYPAQVGATYFAAGVGRNRTFRHLNNNVRTDVNRVDVLGFDLQSRVSDIEVRFEYALSNLQRGDNRVVGSRNKAFDISAGYRFNPRWDALIGYREIEPYFVAPGNWGRIGYLYNPSDLKGTYLNTTYQVQDNLTVRLTADFYTGTAKLPFNSGYQGRDRVRRVMLEANYRYTPRWRFHLTYENVGWEINSNALNNQRGKPEWNYLTLRAAYDLGENIEFNILYQYINTNGKGVALLSGGPSPAGNRAGVFATNLGYRF